LDNQSLKNENINASPVVSDKENDNQHDINDFGSVDRCSASELHTFDYHCNKGLTFEQLASIDPNLVSTSINETFFIFGV
jgi:hypothetical protein